MVRPEVADKMTVKEGRELLVLVTTLFPSIIRRDASVVRAQKRAQYMELVHISHIERDGTMVRHVRPEYCDVV